jgi:hypothetical protein
MIRIGNGQGFWGDWLEAPIRLVEDGPLDYLTLDYLAEVTMSILQKQKKADPRLGYARDFPPLVARLERQLRERNIRVVANAGGVNPLECAREVKRLAPSLCVAVVTGDDILDRIDELLAQGVTLANMDTGDPLSEVRSRLLSANVYLGAFPLAQALDTGAHIVIAGRCSDAALAMAPMIHAFRWPADDWDRLAAGVAAGHIIECGAQCTGGNTQVDWQTIPNMESIGYPIVEMEPDGTFVVTKHEVAGGRVNSHMVKEQLVYEIGDPTAYLTPDCAADFTSLVLEDVGSNRVRVSGARGQPCPPMLKASLSYTAGWRAVGTLVYSWPQAIDKAQAADRIVRARLRHLGLNFDEIHTEYLGWNACHGPVAHPPLDPPEVQLRIGVRSSDWSAVDRFSREIIALVLNGPPTATGYGEGRPPVREVVAYWPTLVPRHVVQPAIEVLE